MLIGRACFAQLRAPVGDNSVGRAHAVAWVDGAGHVFVRDLDSTNGTRVNGTAIARMTLLKPGDQVTFGSEFTLSHQELADRLGDA
jgi:pSer/pThr/pTyr-binding forkhead associated (FHA) protein